jgi:hypothetical protein
LTEPLPWQPDVAPMLLIAVNIAAVVGLCTTILRSTRTVPGMGTAHPVH